MQKTSSVLLLLGAVLLSTALGIGISFLITHLFELTPGPHEKNSIPSLDDVDQWYLRMFVHGVGHIFTFLVPAIFFWYVFENKIWDDFSGSQLSDITSAWISVAVVIFLIPINQQIIDWNQNMQLPEILKEVEGWMRAKEQEKTLLTQGLLRIDSFSKLVVALMVFALIGPIGEEIFFRGVLQRKLGDWGLTPVKSIWLAAIIFSLIHFQFYGFLPRLLLGALFGYLFLWSGSIWIPIIAHVVNNALFVLAAFAYQKQPLLERDIEIITNNRISFIVSLALSVFVLFLFRKQNFNRVQVT
jgi:membrane protease YdiL (CAAX protease family)